jgi:hypothetical protein
MLKISISTTLAALCTACLFAACSPKYNWRDYRSPDAPYTVLFPDKPASYSRNVDLNGLNVKMTMTAAQVGDVMFAVGSAEAPDAAKAQAALTAMKTALVKNIGATITKEKAGNAASTGAELHAAIDVEASGMQKGVPMLLVGHFEERGKRIYQVIVIGSAKTVTRDNVDMFMSSFKLN